MYLIESLINEFAGLSLDLGNLLFAGICLATYTLSLSEVEGNC